MARHAILLNRPIKPSLLYAGETMLKNLVEHRWPPLLRSLALPSFAVTEPRVPNGDSSNTEIEHLV
jgi:hypothetical protein